jgi:transcriptional regulator GlxA family with amidase domain
VLRIKASNCNDVWTEGISINIKIPPPFWLTWWFFSLLALFVLLIFLFIHFYRIRQVIIRERKKYEKTAIDPEMAKQYLDRLLKFMEKEKAYLEHNLTLNNLAGKINISGHYLSQIINKNLNQIFFDFINKYRIRDAKMLIEQDHTVSISHVGNVVGFNSQTAFNRAFKKQMQLTPSEFLNECRIRVIRERLDKCSFDKNISAWEIARDCGFNSLSTFNRVFKKIISHSPADYIKRKRIEFAIKLLKDPTYDDQSIQQIARICGFSSQPAFNRTFKLFSSKLPSDYRN